MKIETTILNLVDAATDATVKADRLAWLCAMLIKKVTAQSPVGDEALKILQKKINTMNGNNSGNNVDSKKEQERKIFEKAIKLAARRIDIMNQRGMDGHDKGHTEQEGTEE